MAEWYANNFKSKGHIEHNTGHTLPYHLDLQRIDGLSKIKNNIEVTLLFYDSVKCCCYGTPWKSSAISPPFSINQELVFHAEVVSSTIMLIEIVQVDSSLKRSTLGWTCIKLLDKNLTNKKLDIYHGSIRSIFFLKEPSLATSQLLRYEGVCVTVTLSQRSSVRGLALHIPSNFLQSPGQLNKFNKTVNPVTLFLENVEVSFGVHIKKFEDHLLFLLMSDAKQQNTNIRQFDKVTIKERRLKASIHNGLNFTDQFQVVYLENVHNAELQSLKSKGVISLTNIDPRYHVIFSLEYVLEVPISFTNLTLVSSMRQGQVQIVSLRWGVWSLLKSLPPSGTILRVPIIGGPGLNPENKLVFSGDFGPMNVNKDAMVVFKLIKQEADLDRTTQHDNTFELTYQDTGVQPDNDIALKSETLESLALPTVDAVTITQRHKAAPPNNRTITPLAGDNQGPHYDIKSTIHQDIDKHDLEKGTYALIHNAGYPDIVDCDGRPALELDLSKHYIYSPGLEKSDPRTCNTIVFQFLAVSFYKAPIRKMFFTVQFYTFLSETTPILSCLISKPPLPGVLHQHSTQSPGSSISFTIDPCKMVDEPAQFLDYIQKGACIIDLWDADSLFHHGSITVKLKRLARQGEHGIQSTQVLNVMHDDDVTAKLHLRIANIGSVPPLYDVKDLTTSLIVDCTGSTDSSELILRPKPLSNVDENLTSILNSKSVKEAAKSRKLARMEAVRRSEDANYIIPHYKNLRAGQLTMVKNYRNKILNDVIRGSLVGQMTLHHHLQTVYGSVTYFEVHFRNPALSTTQDYYLSWDSPDMRLVYDVAECRTLKSLFNLSTPCEEGVFENSKQPAKFTLRPKEEIYIPFCYTSKSTKQEFTYTVKITNEVNSPVQLIKLHFNQQRQIIHERFLFNEPEDSFSKRTLQAPLTVKPDELIVRCSREDVLCGVGAEGSVFFKAPVGKSTETTTFLLLLYIDASCYRPYQIWEVILHSVKRVDLSCVVGSQSKFPVILRGTDSIRCVSCFSSDPGTLQVEPAREFMLLPSTIQEISLIYEPSETGSRDYLVNIVDNKNRVIVERWIVHTSASLPVISKTYNISTQKTLQSVTKNISFTNQYSSAKIFKLKTNKPELVSLKDEELTIPKGESVNIGIVLSPIALSTPNYIIVFVNDIQQKCEECFALRIG